MNTININLYDFLKKEFKLSDVKAKEFAEALSEEIQKQVKAENNIFKSSMKEDFLLLELKMEKNKSDILKWFIGMYFTITLMIIGLYIK